MGSYILWISIYWLKKPEQPLNFKHRISNFTPLVRFVVFFWNYSWWNYSQISMWRIARSAGSLIGAEVRDICAWQRIGTQRHAWYLTSSSYVLEVPILLLCLCLFLLLLLSLLLLLLLHILYYTILCRRRPETQASAARVPGSAHRCQHTTLYAWYIYIYIYISYIYILYIYIYIVYMHMYIYRERER